jgi:hypothetical protein
MRDSCGICTGLYTADDEEEMDRLVLKSPAHSSINSKNSSNSNNTKSATSPLSKQGKKLASIVESKETVDEEQAATFCDMTAVTHIGDLMLVEDEEQEEKKDDSVNDRLIVPPTTGVVAEDQPREVSNEEEIRTPLSSDFTAVPPEGAVEEEEEYDNDNAADNDNNALTSRPQRNFDDNPTHLYLTLMRKDWDKTIVRCGTAPEEVSTWIYRKEHDGSDQLRWKLLPIHASLIFGAPVAVVNAFLTVDSSTALAADDQGMIPLHLAVRMGCPAPIIRALVNAAPESTKRRDRKGRTPRDLALRQTGTVRELLLAALDGSGITTTNKAAVPLPVVVDDVVDHEEEAPAVVVHQEEAPAPLVRSLSPVVTTMTTTPMMMMAPVSPIVVYKPDPALAARVHLLELQLERSEKANADVTAQWVELVSTEARLRSDYALLQQSAEVATHTYVEAETANKSVITNLVNQVGDLQSKVTTMGYEKNAVDAELAHVTEQMDVERGEHQLLVLQLERVLSTTTTLQHEAEESVTTLTAEKEILQSSVAQQSAEMLLLRETIARHEIRLEEVTFSEQELAWKVSTLQETIKNLPDPVAFGRQIDALENEKKELKSTVNKLSVKLYKVVGFLDEMVQEQDAIIVESLTNTTGASPTNDSAATSFAASETTDVNDDRQKLLSNVTGMKEQIGAIIESVLGNMPDYRVADEDDEEAEA